jgi:hypothetical protein
METSRKKRKKKASVTDAKQKRLRGKPAALLVASFSGSCAINAVETSSRCMDHHLQKRFGGFF